MPMMTHISKHQQLIAVRKHIGIRTARGFTMVEVLVSLLILAIGLLGLAGLQASGLRYSGNSTLRTQALLLSQDIVERMRTNPTGVTANNYAVTTSDFTALPASPTPDCGATSCTPANLAAYDLVKWKNTIGSRLPSGASATVAITLNSPSAGTHAVVITLTWSERSTEGGSTPSQSLISTVQL
jgi:type IV pilus assembly protein PilV